MNILQSIYDYSLASRLGLGFFKYFNFRTQKSRPMGGLLVSKCKCYRSKARKPIVLNEFESRNVACSIDADANA